jgi:hypothetical protein
LERPFDIAQWVSESKMFIAEAKNARQAQCEIGDTSGENNDLRDLNE